MNTVRVSSRYQVVIPKGIRDALGIRPGTRLLAIQKGSRIVLVTSKNVRDARGFLRGIDVTVKREPDRL